MTDSPEMVSYFDAENKRIIQIPASELAPGAVQVQIQGHEGLVWTDQHLHTGEIKHPPFDEDLRDIIRAIHSTFSDHRSLSFEEWEEGFRRDNNPEQEMAIWLHAADVYHNFVEPEDDMDHREDVYKCIVACMISSPENVMHVLPSSSLSQEEKQSIIQLFYETGSE